MRIVLDLNQGQSSSGGAKSKNLPFDFQIQSVSSFELKEMGVALAFSRWGPSQFIYFIFLLKKFKSICLFFVL